MEAMVHSSTFLLPTQPNEGGGPCRSYALVVLNNKLPVFTSLLWKHAQMRVCADGGANRLFDELPLLLPHEDPSDVQSRHIPNVIRGDMDSLRPEVKAFYSSLGTEILDESRDQDTTDLHKCVSYVITREQLDKENLTVLVAGALGGRFDHEIGNINVLYKFADTRIILLSNDSILYLLPKTHRHEIHIQPSVEGPHCGLFPMGTPSAKTTTSGLQWDLSETAMHFGGLISTSNIVSKEKITVHSDSDLLWTISIRKPICNNKDN